MNQPFSTIGVALSYSATKEGLYQTLYSIYSAPDMEGSPEQIDVTTFADASRQFIPGVREAEALEFEGYKGKYGAPDAADSERKDEFALLKAMPTDVALYWRLTYPDGSSHSWGGYPFARSTAVEINGAGGYALQVTPSTEMAFTAATGGAG